jgi:glucose-1-phosphate thymidylyltransferase
MLVTGGTSAGDFLRLIGNGEEFGLSRINYAYQKGEGGIAEALGLSTYGSRSRFKNDVFVKS